MCSSNTPYLIVILRWQRHIKSMSTLKCEKKNRVGKSQVPQAERKTSLATLQPWRGVHFLPVLSCLFSRSFLLRRSADLCTLHYLSVSLFTSPPSSYSMFCSRPEIFTYLFSNAFFNTNLLFFCVSAKQIFIGAAWGREWHLRRFVPPVV